MTCTEQQQAERHVLCGPGLHGCPPDLGVPYQGQLLCPWVYEQGPLSRFYCGRAVCSVELNVECNTKEETRRASSARTSALTHLIDQKLHESSLTTKKKAAICIDF